MPDTAITSTTIDVSLLSPPEDGTFFLGRTTLQRFSGQGLPVNARPDAPPDVPLPPHTRWRWDGDAWAQAEDHRGRTGYMPDGTERVITQWGPLPKGWSEVKPEKSLSEVQASKRQEIQAAYVSALAFLIMDASDASPLEAALAVEDMRTDDPDGLAHARALVDARRAELLALVNEAASVSAVEAIPVTYPI